MFLTAAFTGLGLTHQSVTFAMPNRTPAAPGATVRSTEWRMPAAVESLIARALGPLNPSAAEPMVERMFALVRSPPWLVRFGP